MKNIKEIDILVGDCMSELMEHLMQDTIHSQHIKKLKDNLIDIRKLITDNFLDIESNSGVVKQLTGQITKRNVGIVGDKTECLKIAFALSKYDYVFFNKMFGLQLNQTEIFEMVGAMLDVKPSTLRNYRDAFDSHVKQENSKRKGWSKPLSPDLQFIQETFGVYSEQEITNEILGTLERAHPNIDLIVKVAFGFLFARKAVRAEFDTKYGGGKFKVIIASHSDSISYMAFLGGGNTLQDGFYPGIYMFRKYGKVFSVFGESSKSMWPLLVKSQTMRNCFTAEEIEEISKLSGDFLDVSIEKEHVINRDEENKGYYKFKFAEHVVDGMKGIFAKFESDCPHRF